jgi:thioredoxin-dependent peroxiredoxin
MRSLSLLIVGACTVGLLALGAANPSVGQEKGKGKVKVGEKAPAFTSVDETGKEWNSKDHVGKKVIVLYFYPADFTGGCTSQACGYRDEIEKAGTKNVEIIGVSGDTPATHEKFKKDHSLNFTLLADEKGEVANAFGIPVKVGQAKAVGKTSKGEKIEVVRSATINRWTVVIDKTGTIVAIDQITKGAGDDAKRVAQLVQKLDSK